MAEYDSILTRRHFLALTGSALLADAVAHWRWSGSPAAEPPERLIIPSTRPTRTAALGMQRLGLGAERDGFLYAPESYSPDRAAPLLVLLHGAGQSASMWFGSYRARSEESGILMLAPDSRGPTWDAIRDGFGPDVAFINEAFAWVFARYLVDRKRITLVGFSDGASYAISLGLANGDVVPNIIAYSPGFVIGAPHRGTPAFFVSHGTADNILPIDRAGRPVVAGLRRAGYSVEFKEFDGRHEVPPVISDAALAWLRTRK